MWDYVIFYGGGMIVEKERLYKCNLVQILFSGENSFKFWVESYGKAAKKKGLVEYKSKFLFFLGQGLHKIFG